MNDEKKLNPNRTRWQVASVIICAISLLVYLATYSGLLITASEWGGLVQIYGYLFMSCILSLIGYIIATNELIKSIRRRKTLKFIMPCFFFTLFVFVFTVYGTLNIHEF